MTNPIVYLSLCILFFAISASAHYSVDQSESNCKCENNDCGCCAHMEWDIARINGTVCTNFTYLPNDYGISATLTWNDYTLLNTTVSARNPPPFCFGIPELEDIKASICLKLYDLTFKNKHFHGCGKLTMVVFHIVHKSIDLGCFLIPNDSFVQKYKSESEWIRKILREEMENLEFWKKTPEVMII